jgi:hypothetical protein
MHGKPALTSTRAQLRRPHPTQIQHDLSTSFAERTYVLIVRRLWIELRRAPDHDDGDTVAYAWAWGYTGDPRTYRPDTADDLIVRKASGSITYAGDPYFAGAAIPGAVLAGQPHPGHRRGARPPELRRAGDPAHAADPRDPQRPTRPTNPARRARLRDPWRASPTHALSTPGSATVAIEGHR